MGADVVKLLHGITYECPPIPIKYCFLFKKSSIFWTQMAAMGTGTWGMRDKFKFYQKNLEV